MNKNSSTENKEIYQIINQLINHKFSYEISYPLIHNNINLLKQICQEYSIDCIEDLSENKIILQASSSPYLHKLKNICKQLIINFDNNNPDQILTQINEIKKLLNI